MTIQSNRFVKIKYQGFHYIGEGESETIVQKLGFRNMTVLITLALHQNDECVTDLTIDQLSELLNMSRKTVQNSVNELRDFQYEGQPVVEVTQIGSGRNRRNYYHILFNPLVSQYGESVKNTLQDKSCSVNFTPQNESYSVKITPQEDVYGVKNTLSKETCSKEIVTKEKNNKERTDSMNKKFIVQSFRDLLNEKGIEVKFSYPQVYAKMKRGGVDPLFENMNEEQVTAVLKFIVNEYGNGAIKADLLKYPLDMQVITRKWVVERAIQLIDKEQRNKEKDMSRIKNESVVADRRNNKAIQSIMDRIRKGGK